MSARDIALALGDACRVGHDYRCRCPVHHGHSLTLADGRDGKLLIKCFAGCNWRDIFDELRSLRLIANDPGASNPERGEERRRREEGEAKGEIERLRRGIASARDLYRRAQAAAGTSGEIYLCGDGIEALELPKDPVRRHRRRQRR
jgi:hypothetical protein